VLVLLAMPLTWPKIMLVGAALAGFVLLFLARAVPPPLVSERMVSTGRRRARQ